MGLQLVISRNSWLSLAMRSSPHRTKSLFGSFDDELGDPLGLQSNPYGFSAPPSPAYFKTPRQLPQIPTLKFAHHNDSLRGPTLAQQNQQLRGGFYLSVILTLWLPSSPALCCSHEERVNPCASSHPDASFQKCVVIASNHLKRYIRAS